MDDFDIYSDLPDFAWLKQVYEADVEIKKEDLPISESDIKELKEKLLKLEKVHKLVLSHYSSLWKTSKQERKRMDRQIAELRSQLDNFAFKRNHHHRYAVPPPAPIQPAIPYHTELQASNDYLPPLMGTALFSKQHNNKNSFCYPPPPVTPALDNNQVWSQQEEPLGEHFVDNIDVPSNVITPENSHGSDESEDDIIKKSEYRSTVYGERLRKKLLEEKRNAMKQKQESVFDEKKNNQEQLKFQKQNTLQNTNEVNKLHVLKKGTDVKRQSEIKTQNVKESSQQEQKLRNEKAIEAKENKKKDEVMINKESDFDRKRREEDLKIRKRDDIDKKKEMISIRNGGMAMSERDLDKKIEDKDMKMKRERGLERRKQENESRIRQERDLERRRNEEENEKTKREELFEKRRREEEIEKRRKDQETEKRKKEEIDKRRAEIDRQRKDEEIERRKRDEFDRKKKEEEKKRKERELQVLKEKENEQRRKEEEQHIKKLKEIERKRNEKQLEDLIKERKRIENEMDTLKHEESEQEEKLLSVKDARCKEQSGVEQSQVGRRRSKETFEDNSKQSNKNQSDIRSNDKGKAGERCWENKNSLSASSITQTIKDNRRNNSREYVSYKSDWYQNNHTSYDKHKYNDRHSRRDQIDRECEHRKSLYRDKPRPRNKSSSGHRSDENKSNYSPKRIKLQAKDGDCDDKLKNPGTGRKYQTKVKSPKRRRQTSEERSPQKSKKRKTSQNRDLDYDITSNENTTQKINFAASNKLDEVTIIDNAMSNKSISTYRVGTGLKLIENTANRKGHLKEEKGKSIATFTKHQDKALTKLIDPQKALQSVYKKDQVNDPSKRPDKLVNTMTNKNNIDHANKVKTLINELFEDRERPVGMPANTNNVQQLQKTLDETILSELEDGEITDCEESMDSVYSSKLAAHIQATDRPIETITLEKNKSRKESNQNEFTAFLQNGDMEAGSKCTSEIKDSILYNVIAQSKHDSGKEKGKIELHGKMSNRKEPSTLEDYKIPETCNTISNKSADKPSQIISNIEHGINKNSETVDTKNVNKHTLPEVKETKTIAESSDILKTIIEEEKPTSGNKINYSGIVAKTNSEKTAKSTLSSNVLNTLSKQPNSNYLKNNNSENKIDNKERSLYSKKTEIHSETNSTKVMCLKENLITSSDLIKKNIEQTLITEILNKESSNAGAKIETPCKDVAVKNSVNNTPQTKISLRNVIVIKRRRRPVQLSDSPPVVVINNTTNVKT